MAMKRSNNNRKKRVMMRSKGRYRNSGGVLSRRYGLQKFKFGIRNPEKAWPDWAIRLTAAEL